MSNDFHSLTIDGWMKEKNIYHYSFIYYWRRNDLVFQKMIPRRSKKNMIFWFSSFLKKGFKSTTKWKNINNYTLQNCKNEINWLLAFYLSRSIKNSLIQKRRKSLEIFLFSPQYLLMQKCITKLSCFWSKIWNYAKYRIFWNYC